MHAFITSRINDRRRQLADLERQRDELDRMLLVAGAELRAYEDMLANVSESVGDPARAPVVVKTADSTPRVKRAEYAAARMTPAWRELFEELGRRFPEVMTNEEMLEHSGVFGHPINSQTLRSTLSTYTARGWLERKSAGRYRITRAGADVSGVSVPNQNSLGDAPKEDRSPSADAQEPHQIPVPGDQTGGV